MRGESSVARIIRAFTFELLDRLGNVIARLAEIPDIDISVRDSIGLQFVPPEMEFDQFPAEDDSLGMFMTPAPDDTAGAPQRSMWLGGPVIIDSGTNERRPFVYLSARADQTHPDRGHTQAQMFASQVGPEATVTLGNTDLGGGDNSAFGFLSVANVLAEIARVAVQSTPSGAGRDVFCRLSAGDRVFARVRDDPDGNREILLSLDAADDFDVVLGENNFRATYGAGRFVGVSGLSAHLVHDDGVIKVGLGAIDLDRTGAADTAHIGLLDAAGDEVVQLRAGSGASEALLQIREIGTDSSIRVRHGGAGQPLEHVASTPETAPVLAGRNNWAPLVNEELLVTSARFSTGALRKFVTYAGGFRNDTGAASVAGTVIANIPAGYEPIGGVHRVQVGWGATSGQLCVLDFKPDRDVVLVDQSAGIPNGQQIHARGVSWWA